MVSLNQLFYGDNLSILRDYVADESVDLVYLDPPFNSNANYNILFRSPTGAAADGQIEAFEDTWRYGTEAANAYHEVIQSGRSDIAELLRSIQGFLGQNDMMAYLAMMAVRLIELHRVLKPTGSLYLHCDPTASHYLNLLLDGLFGPRTFARKSVGGDRSRTTTRAKAALSTAISATPFCSTPRVTNGRGTGSIRPTMTVMPTAPTATSIPKVAAIAGAT
ncbi:hypothetical protein FHR19_003109 [Sphingomonas yantingensis]|uniref:site-specific DNA-methyltransferase (adenine-specific) n=1 Tax=Sphingomonas yantingensis TaxID=1241761 RepID=A0A7W9EK74_9SPHN|nr:DNA methyltransferase [Sphingomonas yantingensis]MBB5699735.1 hypothetical protein [Sphingomonas yantingensis]